MRSCTRTSMMRIAVAGAGGLGFMLVHELSKSANSIILLSSRAHPEIEQNLDIQVAVVNYDEVEQMRYTLQGVDLVISTIAGNEQVNLINAARRARVRVFVPSEFEGGLVTRPASDPLERGSSAALNLLLQHSQSNTNPMRFTIFSCGIFYEHFAPGGLGAFGLGAGQPGGLQRQGSFLIDIASAKANVVEINIQGSPVYVSMTSASDVARSVAAAVELGVDTWPRELRVQGDRLSVRELVGTCSSITRVPFEVHVYHHKDLHEHLRHYSELGDWQGWFYTQRLLATANGRYELEDTNLQALLAASDAVGEIPRLVPFREWMQLAWQPPSPENNDMFVQAPMGV